LNLTLEIDITVSYKPSVWRTVEKWDQSTSQFPSNDCCVSFVWLQFRSIIATSSHWRDIT